MKRSVLGQICIFLLLATSCVEVESIIPKPSISVSNEFSSNWSGYITGQTYGVDPDRFHLAIYAKMSGFWYNLPDVSPPSFQFHRIRNGFASWKPWT